MASWRNKVYSGKTPFAPSQSCIAWPCAWFELAVRDLRPKWPVQNVNTNQNWQPRLSSPNPFSSAITPWSTFETHIRRFSTIYRSDNVREYFAAMETNQDSSNSVQPSSVIYRLENVSKASFSFGHDNTPVFHTRAIALKSEIPALYFNSYSKPSGLWYVWSYNSELLATSRQTCPGPKTAFNSTPLQLYSAMRNILITPFEWFREQSHWGQDLWFGLKVDPYVLPIREVRETSSEIKP